MWYETASSIDLLANWLAAHGYSPREIEWMREAPWQWGRYYQQALLEKSCTRP